VKNQSYKDSILSKCLVLFLLGFLLQFSACSLYQLKAPPLPDITSHYAMDNKGRDTSYQQIVQLYTKKSLNHVDFPLITDSLIIALKNHQTLLKIRKQDEIQVFDNLELSIAEMEKTIEILLQLREDPSKLKELDAYLISGEKETGNVKFTGYYTPLIQVSKRKTKSFKYPIYSKPDGFIGKLPTRKAIDFENILEGRGLELAYAKSRLDVYFMQLQGSGYVQYRDGSRQMFGYGGSNGHPYRSIGRYLKNNDYRISSISEKGLRKFFNIRPDLISRILPNNNSYTFFKPRNTPPKGAGHVPLLEGTSCAVDRRYIPLGATALASIPLYDEKDDLIGHELRILLAQDVGGAIKGAGHIDLYMGDSENAVDLASKYYHYGKIWLLTPVKPMLDEPVNVSLSDDISI